jgi:hypothetical protein
LGMRIFIMESFLSSYDSYFIRIKISSNVNSNFLDSLYLKIINIIERSTFYGQG